MGCTEVSADISCERGHFQRQHLLDPQLPLPLAPDVATSHLGRMKEDILLGNI